MQQRGPKTSNVGLLYLVCLRSVADGFCVLKYRYTLLLIFPRVNYAIHSYEYLFMVPW